MLSLASGQTSGCCVVPGCKTPVADDAEDCCPAHSKIRFAPHGNLTTIPNDGVVDRIAIDLAVQGARPVNLTWVERDIAAAVLLASGADADEIKQKLGQNLLRTEGRRKRIEDMAQAIREDGLRATA